jgi:hypothetical protein
LHVEGSKIWQIPEMQLAKRSQLGPDESGLQGAPSASGSTHLPVPPVSLLQLPRAHRASSLLHTPPASTHWMATHFFVDCEHAPLAHWLLLVHVVPTGPGAPHLPSTHASSDTHSPSDLHAAPAAPRRVHFTVVVVGPPNSTLHDSPSSHCGGTEAGAFGS